MLRIRARVPWARAGLSLIHIYHGVGETIGIRLNPEDIHIMHKSEYSGLFGDYSSYSAEYDELTEDAEDEEE